MRAALGLDGSPDLARSSPAIHLSNIDNCSKSARRPLSSVWLALISAALARLKNRSLGALSTARFA
jgi:hypothetical protein